MQKEFILDKHKKFLIYGVGGNGLKLCDVVEQSGYNLLGFIDQRAQLLGNIKGKQIWTMDTISQLSNKSDEIVVLVTIKNVFEHTSIAYQLARKGFKQCIYKPLPILQGIRDEDLEKISKIHDRIVIDLYMPEQQILPRVTIHYQLNDKDKLLIQKNKPEGQVTAWLPLELLFNYKTAPEYENVSMMAFFPLIGLYRLFLGSHGDNGQDIIEDFYSYTSQWAKRKHVNWDEGLKKSLLHSRYEVFKHMEKIVECDFDFFIRNAPEVKLDDDMCRFHMTNSGRNRVAYLAAKGYQHVPVKMSQTDYKGWIHQEAFDLLKAYMQVETIMECIVPIPHPCLKQISIRFIEYSKMVCCPIAEFLIRSLYRSSRICTDGYLVIDPDQLRIKKQACNLLVCMDDDGALSRYANAMGFSVMRLSNPKRQKIIALLDRLFRQQVEEYRQTGSESIQFIIFDENITEVQIKMLLTFRPSYIIYFGKHNNEMLNYIIVKLGLQNVRCLGNILCDFEMKHLILYAQASLIHTTSSCVDEEQKWPLSQSALDLSEYRE